jgi:asparagine synthase (glutamine-hydrolysing)
MNLFFAGWNIDEGLKRKALAALRRLAHVYPTIDLATEQIFDGGQDAFVAVFSPRPAQTRPRVSVFRDADRISVVEGVVVDPNGRVNTRDAGAVVEQMDRVTQFEGQFVVISATRTSLTIVNDALGVYQVYDARSISSFLFSNSATLLTLLVNASQPDPLGVSAFASLGWTPDSRTLRVGVAAMEGGQQWRFERDRPVIQKRYYDRASLAFPVKRRLRGSDVSGLLHQLTEQIRAVRAQTGRLDCPITAGRDSRVLVALTLRAEVDVEYFSCGHPESNDARIGRRIAGEFKLRHNCDRVDLTAEEILAGWEELSARVIARNDGMVTLAHIRNAVDQGVAHEDLIGTELYGAGGEIARGYWSGDYSSCFGRVDRDSLVASHIGTTTLLTDAGRQVVREFLRDFARQTEALGFPARDITDAFYLFERMRRWAGIQFGQVRHEFDEFSPFCTRPYVEAAFRMPHAQRVMEVLPLRLISSVSPALLDVPFERPLMPRNGIQLWLHFMGGRLKPRLAPPRPHASSGVERADERLEWLEAMRSRLSSVCLDHQDSALWSFVSRPAFERLMRGNDNEGRKRNRERLYSVVTLFEERARVASLRQSVETTCL